MGACLSSAAPRAKTTDATAASPPGINKTPLFRLGLIADIQYADMADSGVEGRVQRFREVPSKLKDAVVELAAMGKDGHLAAVLVLGDIINGNREDESLNPSDLETVAAILDGLSVASLQGRVFHVLGNHCLDLPREEVMDRLGFPLVNEKERGQGAPRRPYYSARLAPGWRLVALDTTDISGHTQAGPEALAESEAYLAAHPLSAAEPQMSPWNGGLGKKQAAWLIEELASASAAGERVIVAGHHQAGPPPAVRATHAAWNSEEIRGIVSGGKVGMKKSAAAPSPSPAVLYLAGHDHTGGWSHAGGVHWVTVEGLVEAPSGSNAWGVLEVFADGRMVVKGRGSVTSRVLTTN